MFGSPNAQASAHPGAPCSGVRRGIRVRTKLFRILSTTGRLVGMSGPPEPAHDATLMLQRINDGDLSAAEELLPLVYEQLRAVAGGFFRHQHADHTLQPTALVHEAYMKLVAGTSPGWEGESHFCAVAATAMRHILRDHARAKRAAKRSAEGGRVPLTAIEPPAEGPPVDILALDDALTELQKLNPRGARIVELRFFAGLSQEQAAHAMGVPLRTVEREWRRSKAWMQMRLEESDG